jgi:hypothetical protein
MKKKCKGCGKTRGIHWFSISGSNFDGRKHLCQDCENDRTSKYRSKKQTEKDFWRQFSPVNFY